MPDTQLTQSIEKKRLNQNEWILIYVKGIAAELKNGSDQEAH